MKILLAALLLMLAGCASQVEDAARAPGRPLQPQQAATSADALVQPEKGVVQGRAEYAPQVSIGPQPLRADAAAAAPEVSRHIAGGFAPPPFMQPAERERYQALTANPVRLVAEAPVSTFSIDVDTGSYANVRRFLNQGRLPPADAVRVEELINYFPYDYAQPSGRVPFAVHTELAPAPWNANNILLRIGIKGQDLAKQSLPPANLVFLVDVSGSMTSNDKLPLLKSSMKLLVKALRPQDRITLVTYAGQTAVVLPPTPGSDTNRVLAAIDSLTPGGSTAGASGIELAYSMAQQSFIAGGINRILLATDGDFNVGITDFRALKSLVEERRKSGVSLSTLGFGSGNYNEQLMEQLADAGDGAYSYIDNLMEGHKVLVNELTSTLATIARDVKIQVEFSPAAVKEYRLIGYENRLLNREDFNNDKVDAGDIGAGHTVTALYELTLAGGKGLIEPLRYRSGETGTAPAATELAHVKLRYKAPGNETSELIEVAIERSMLQPLAQVSAELRFAGAVAGFGQLLRGGRYTGKWSYADVRELASANIGADRYGYRGEFLRLVDLAQSLATRAPTRGELSVEQ